MRSSWKLPYILRDLTIKCLNNDYFWYIYLDKLKNENLRKYMISPKLNYKLIYIHNGKYFIQTQIFSRKFRHKLGEFSVTKVYGKGKKKK